MVEGDRVGFSSGRPEVSEEGVCASRTRGVFPERISFLFLLLFSAEFKKP
jgi:hypothetical protein